MKRTLLSVVGATLLAASATAQAPANSQTAQAAISIPTGATFNAVLVGSLDSIRQKPGDAVTARLTENVSSGNTILLPKNTRLIGHITIAAARGKGDEESMLAFQFDKAVLKTGEEVALTAVLQALAPPQEIMLATSAGDDAGISSTAGGSAGGHTPTIIAAGGTVNNAVNAAVNAANQATATADASATSSAGSTSAAAGSATTVGGGVMGGGRLAPNSRGVLQIKGLTLASASASGPAIMSAGRNVRLDSGTRLLLVTQAQAGAEAKP